MEWEAIMGAKKKVAFIDLEDTVITPVMQGWIAAEPLGLIRKVSAVLRQWEPDEVRVFSFAVRDRSDVEGFNLHVRPWLEQALGFKLSQVPTTDGEIIPEVARLLNLHKSKVDFSDVVDFLGKGGSFRLFARSEAAKEGVPLDVLLIDDAVEDERFEFERLGLSGRLVNADRL